MQKFLRTLTLLALIAVPWVTQAQSNAAKVMEYDYSVATAAYNSIATTGTAWTADDMSQGYVDVAMPFGIQFGETAIASGSTLRVYPDGSAVFTDLAESRIAPLRYSSGYTPTATSIYTKALANSSEVVVEWRKVVPSVASASSNSYSFQLRIAANGNIKFCYGPMTINSSVSVIVGLMSSNSDIYRVGGANGTSSWDDITRYTTGATTTRTLSTTYKPTYDAVAGTGLVYTFTQPACVKPNTFTATAASSSAINLAWTLNDAGVKYEIKYSTNEDFDPATEGTQQWVNDGSALSASVTGLSPNTTYYFALRKYCNANTPSGWIMASATTDCGPFTAADLPIFEDFDSYTASSTASIHRCWTKTYGYNGSHTSYPYPSTTYKHSGNNSLYFYSSSTASYRSWVAIPYSGPMNNICVNFWVLKTSAAYGNIQVGVMSDPDDFSTFELVANAGINSTEYSTSTWYNQEVYFDNYTGNGTYIVILAPSGATNYAYVDDITISTLPACRRLSGLQVSPSGLVTWNAISGATFEVKYATSDFDPTVSGTANTVSTNSFQIPSPAGSTTYYVYVRNVCNDYWKKATFTTPLTMPFSEDFSASTFPPSGWQRLTGLLSNAYSGTNPTSTTSGWTRYTSNYGLEAPHAKLNIYGTTYKYWLVTPNIYISGNAELTFDMALTKYGNANAITPGSQSDDKFAVLVSTDGGATWTQSNTLALWDNAGSSYVYDNIPNTGTTVVLPLTAYTGQSIMIAFYGESTVSGGDNDLHIDNISVDIHRSCAKPSDLAATNITTNGATVTWTENSETAATQWKVKWANHTFTSDDTDVDSAIVNGTAQKVLAGLTPGTTYYFMVQALCDVTNGDISAWSTMSNFTTAFGVPFSEDFTTTTFPPTGWSRLTGLVNNAFSGTNPTSYSGGWARATTSYGLSTQPFARGNIYGTSWKHWLVTPNISIDVNAALSFDIALTGYSSSGNSAAQTTGTDDRFVVLVSTDNGATWSSSNVLREWNNSGSTYVYNDISRYGEHVIIPLTAYQGQSVKIAFYGESQTSNADNYFYIDNVAIDQIVSCYPVTNVAADNVTATSVDLSWGDNNTNPDSWTVIYGAPGFDPATAGTSVTATTNPFTLTGLTPQTSYDVYVRANCVTGSDVSALSSVYNFATTCTNPCYDSIYMTDDYGDGWEGHTIDLYVNGALKTQYTLSSGSEGSALIQMCPGDQIQLKWSQNGGYMYGENNFEIYNHDNVLIYSCIGEDGLSDGITLWSGRACFTPNCHTPNQLDASNITYTTATIDWAETTTPAPTQWVLAYGVDENNLTEVSINTKPYSLTGLTANTNYYYKVRAVCEVGVDSSDWSLTSSFYTGYCVPAPSSVDNSGMTNIAFGDALVVNTDTTYGLTYGDFTNLIGDAGQGTNAEVVINYGTGYTYGTHIWVDWNNDLDFNDAGELVYTGLSESTNPTTLAATFAIPANTALGDYRMRIGGSDNDDGPDACYTGSWACLFDFTLRVTPAPTCYKPTALAASSVFGTQATLNWTENTPTPATSWQLTYTANGTTNYQVVSTKPYTMTGLTELTDYTNVMVRAICGAGDTSNWSAPVNFTTTAACMAPTGLAGTASENSATLSWTENTMPVAATRWEIAYGPQGFDIDNEDEYTTREATTNNAFVFSGLHHSTTYDFYVRAICGDESYSDWSNRCRLTTACGAWSYADMPLVEDFDGVTGTTTSTTTVLPNSCWSKINTGSNYYGRPQVYSSSTYAKSGVNSMYFYVGTGDAYANNYAILPEFGFDLDTIDITLSARFGSSTSVITIGVMSDPEDVSTFVPVTTIAAPSTGYSTHATYEASLRDYDGTARYIAIAALKGSATNYFYIDDLNVKLREKLNHMSDNGATLAVCNEMVMPDTTATSYHGNVNATYVINPAEAGKMVHLNGTYDLEYGYDFLTLYEGTGSNKTLVGTYTGKGNIDFMSESSDWVNHGSVTLVFTSDGDNAFTANTGFKLLASCECPLPSPDTLRPVYTYNGEYTWINGETYTNHATTANAEDSVFVVFYNEPNVAGCDSVYHEMTLTLHPTYTLNYTGEICERDTFNLPGESGFYGQFYTTTGNYTVTLQSQYGADSTGILALQVHEAPTADIYYNGRAVEEVTNFCDNFDMALLARSNLTGATFEWEDASTAANRTVNPHETSTYTLVATDPNYGCTSLPATLTVTTTPVPALTISGDAAICAGQSTTLTLTDANNVPATYRWSTNATTESITVTPTATTTYTVTATSTTGACVATAEFTVTVNPLPVVTATAAPTVLCQNATIDLTATEVEGYNYSWNTGAATAAATVAATATGNYTVTVTDANGCVNEFTTNNVTVNPVYELNDEQSACVGMLPVTWGTQSLAVAGSYDQTFQTINGCDSIVHLTFTVQDTALNNTNRELCEGAAFTFGTGIYEQAYTATTSTVITYVDTTSGECPARYNLNLTVNTHNPATVENTVCDTYTWPLNNETYTTSGAYQTTLQTTKGCDSVVTLNLTVNYQNTGVENVTACDSYTWDLNGETYTEPTNTPTFTLTNAAGCDSVVTLNLSEVYHSTFGVDAYRVCDSRSFTWVDGHTYRLSVDSTEGITYLLPGITNVAGCDSTIILHLELNPVIDTMNWATVNACDEYVIDTVACDGTISPKYIRESGDYEMRTYNTTTNRDQWTRLHITVTPSNYQTTIVTACVPYTWNVVIGQDDNGDILYPVGTYDPVGNDTIVSFDMPTQVAQGCSDIRVLRLHALRKTTGTETMVICNNEDATTLNGTTIYGSNYTPGEYTLPLITTTVNNDGCAYDSTLVLTVNPLYSETMELTLCESQFTFDTVNGKYVYTLNDDKHVGQSIELTYDTELNGSPLENLTESASWQTATGCDSVVNITYTVNPTTTETETVQALTRYVWAENGVRYEGLGEHIDTVVSSNEYGCTLYKVLNLTITDSIRHYDTINVCTSYEVNGETYVEDMTFVEVDDNKEVYYTTYHVLQRTLNEVNVVSNVPYTWINGEEYTANVSNVYYSAPATTPGECDTVYKLNFTMVPAITICEGQLPYETGYGYTIENAVSGQWNNNDANGNDTIIAYTVNLNVTTPLTETACDTYTWNDSILGNTTYTESGEYTKTYTAANGCDSIVTLTLTINVSTDSTMAATACDSYVWNTQTYDSTGVYTYQTTNLAGCDSTVTLNLTINKNNGVEETVTACDSLMWNGQKLTVSNDYSKTFTDVNGCTGDSVLHLTINNTVTANADSIVNAASTIYMGVLYNAPLDTVINDTTIAGAANGCDSITMMHLQVKMGAIVTVDTVSCGDFTWLDGNTYTWIPMSERLNPAFNYKNLATNQPVEDFPVVEKDLDGDGLIDSTYVLHLVMAEASTEYKTVTVLLSDTTYTDPLDTTNHVFDFTAYRNAGVVGQDPIVEHDTLHYASSYYCDSIVYYTFNLIYNYVDDPVETVCNEVSTYTTANGKVIALNEGSNTLTDTTAAGTANAMVHNKTIVRSTAITGTETIAACDSVTWNNTLFTANVVDSLVTLTAANGCDSVVTLNITITPTVHNVIEPANVCDTYYWADKDSTYEVSTTDTWSRANATDAQCTDVDTLKLVVNVSTASTDVQTACDTYTWPLNNETYTTSNNTAYVTLTNAAGCDSVVTLNLTVNYSFTGAGTDIDTLGASITLTDKNGTTLILAPYDNDTTLVYQTVAGCDSTVTFHLTVNQFQIVAENPIECGIYTWMRNNHTYKWISDTEKSANAINIPGASPMLPLYKDETTGNYVYNNPLDTVGSIVYLLNLNLNEAQFEDSTIARFPQSVNKLTLHGTTFDFTGLTSATKLTADTVVTLTLPNATLCGTVMKYNVHVVYNYTTDDTTVCYTDTYTWEDNTTSTVTVGSGNTITKTLFAGDWANEQVVTRTITVRPNNNTATVSAEPCDTYTWNGQTYTTTGDYTFDTIDQYGCDSTVTLNLTMKYSTNAGETLVACDSAQWHGIWYKVSSNQLDDSITYAYTAGNGCPSVDTLHLTVNHNVPQVVVVDTCNSYTWDLSGYAYDESDSYIANRIDGNGCNAVDTLKLTIRTSTSYDSVLYVTDGSYRYTAQDNTTTLIMAGQVATFAEHYTNAAGCDSTLNIEIHVGEGYFAVDDTTVCDSYTWRDGNTYIWISAEERAANGNALYKNQTTGAYVMSNPIYSSANAGTYDSIYMLRLNLTQNYTEIVNINFPISLGTLVYGDSTFVLFDGTDDEGREFVNTAVEKEVHFHSDYYCDSIHYLHINLQNNYSEVAAEARDICVTQDTVMWRNVERNTATTDFDHAHTYYFYDVTGTAEAPVVEYIKVTQHPVVYATERRTACDSYTWNGRTFTESTSNATYATTDQYGCDSTVTLILNIKKSTDSTLTTAACETYTWSGITYTESADTTITGLINAVGCDSTATLHLTVNYKTSTGYTVDACDSYKWENGTNITYTAAGTYYYSYDDAAGVCTSVDTLYLTLRSNSNQGYTQAACDSYVWHDSTYTASTTAYYEYEAANGCPSVDTLYLTINVNNGFAETLTACDSIDWNGHVYYTTGEYTVHYADANGCEADSVLTLTVNNATHNNETIAACDTYTWHNVDYTTSGVKTYSYDNGAGCASVDTLHLTIYQSDFNGENYATLTVSDWCGDYTWVVNDSTVGTYTESVETSTSFTSPVTGCDSIVFLHLTIKNAPVIDTTATVCENALPYEWRGIEMNAAGVETIAFPMDNGCDSTIRFTLNVNPKYDTQLSADVCLGSGYTGNGFDIAAEDMPEVGEYTFTKELTSEYGCDSIVTLTVNVKSLFATTIEQTACDSYTWDLNNVTYTVSGNYEHIIPAANSCDSVITLALTINNSTTGVDVQTACNRYTWIDGNTYYENNNTATFTLDGANAAGCDSVVTLNLTVNYSNNSEFDAVACDSYTWNGATYSQSGNYTYAGTNVDGCDSVVTLHLTINNSTTATVEATACNSYEWTEGNGQTYTESGNYTYTTTAANGCDSVVTLALTINTPANTTEEVTACESYVWNNETYTTSGQYTYDFVDGNGCDAVATLNLTINTPASTIETVTACDSYSWNNQTYTNSGEYTNAFVDANGCTAKATLILTINASSSSNDVVTTCGSYDWNGQTYSQTGLYTFDTLNAAGCDSTATLSLVINQSVSSTETATACDSYEWNNTVYTESGVYTFNSTTGEGCDSVATLLLTIKNSTNNAETVTVCDSYTWNNTEYTTSGDYTYSYTNAAGCASVDTLHLTINASTEETVNATACDTYTWTTGNGQTYTTSGNYTYQTTNLAGCEHLVTLALTINNATSSTTTEEACNSYTWNGQTYNQTGIYTYQTTNAHGCDSVATLALTIKPSYASTESQTACGSYTWNGQTYSQTGLYTYSTTATNGCDSVMTLSLTINNPVNNTVNQTACDSYTWTGATGATYTTSGDYTYTTTSALTGCDSVTTLHLTINPATSESVYAESCSSYIWNGQTYNQSGVYTYQTTNVHGCDSTVTLQLNIMQPALTTIDRIVCDSYTWNGQTYTASGNYTYNTTTLEGCDSTVVLVLTVNNSYNVNIAETACSSYSWNGQTYTTSGNYSQVFAAANGCDSTVTLALTINTPVTETVVESACSSYEWNGETYTTSGVYTYTTTGANGCDSVTTLYLTINLPVYVNIDVNAEGNYNWNGETYTESGVYTYTTVAANGCDSVTTLNLTVTPVYTVTLVSINDEWGTVSESGTIAENGYFTATATANEGYVFLAWVNSDIDTVSTNATYVFQVTEDITLYAVFVPKQVGIEDVDMDNVTIYSTDSRIIVRGAEGHDVYVYDVNGRMMDRQLNAPENLEFRMTATGVYLVKVGNAPAKRVVVVR